MTAVLLECGHAVTEVVEIGGEHRCGAVIDSEPVEEAAEEPAGTVEEAEPGTLIDGDWASVDAGEERQDIDAEDGATPGLALVQPKHSVRADEPGARGCWAISNRTGLPCGSPRMRGHDYCVSHSGLGISADPTAYSPAGHQAQRRNREIRASMRLLYGNQRNTGPRAALRAAVERESIGLAGRAVGAALSPESDPVKAAHLAVKLIESAEPRMSASLEITGELDANAMDKLSFRELLSLAASHGIDPSTTLPALRA